MKWCDSRLFVPRASKILCTKHHKFRLSSLSAAIFVASLQKYEPAQSLTTPNLSPSESLNASKPPKDKSFFLERCSWNDPNLSSNHRINLFDLHFGGQEVVADGMEEIWNCGVWYIQFWNRVVRKGGNHTTSECISARSFSRAQFRFARDQFLFSSKTIDKTENER